MITILPPPKPAMPIADPGIRVSIAPFPHVLFLEDYEYYDQLGRDPLQQNLVWGIKDDVARVEKLKEVLESHPLPKEKHRRSVLATAAGRGDEAVVRFLVGTGLRVQPRVGGEGEEGKDGGEDEEMKDDEDDEGDDDGDDDGSIPDVDDSTVLPLHIAAQNGKFEIIKILIEEGKVDVDARAEDGRTSLTSAAYGGNTEMVRYLLDHGADVSVRGDPDDEKAIENLGTLAGAGVIEYAAASGNLECVKLLYERLSQGKRRADGLAEILITPLAIQGAAGKNYETLRFLLEQGNYKIADLQINRKLLSDAQREVIREATPPAAESGDLDSLKLLLSYQYPLDEADKPTSFDPLGDLHKALIYGTYNAARHNNLQKLKYLLSFNLKQHDSMSLDGLPKGQLINTQHLFEIAVRGGAIDTAKFILEELGANPDLARIPAGVFPLYYAAICDKPEMVSFLLDRGVDIHLGSGRFAAGPTALYGAIALKSLGGIELLFKHGGPVDHVDDEIVNIDKPLTAVLRAVSSDGRYEVRLESKANVEEWVEEYRETCTVLNPPYVLLQLDAGDRTWIDKLQRRKRDARLRESGPKARELNAKEAADLDEVLEDDARHLMVECPTEAEREDELAGDDELCPAWRPAFVPA